MLHGLSTITVSPLVKITSYITEGLVAMISMLNSLLILSLIISICNNPRKPHLKPKPKASLVSGSLVNEASLSFSFIIASFRASYLLGSIG